LSIKTKAMAATAASYMPHSNSQSAASAGTFSPLTMFECTISSATMLIDSMAVRDLLLAFKIVAQLHGHLLEVLDPTVQRLANVADEHSLCPPPPATTAAAAAAVPSSVAICSGKQILDGPKTESMQETLAEEQLEEEDDCILIETDMRPLFDTGSQPAAPKVPRLSSSSENVSMTMSDNFPGELSNEWKTTLRKAYRVLKDESGTDVFDFNLSYSAAANVRAAAKVIERALELGPHKPANIAAWHSVAGAYVARWFRCNLKPSAKRAQNQLRIDATVAKVRSVAVKLNRRQKAYDSIRSELDPATRTKIESAVLNRDYTSSDEEDTSTAGDGVDQQTADEQSQPLRVRELTWESEELRQLKNRLDSVAAASAPVVRRQSGVYSDRPAPVYDGLDWARKPAAAADNTTAGASSSGSN
ncbi:hypothetical protein BOX15_Mlig004600g1, partial [Macrostomum lignano]